MPALHQVLAAEKTAVGAFQLLLKELHSKFGKAGHFFNGKVRTLKMIQDSPEAKALEDGSREVTLPVTNVLDATQYVMDQWVRTENLLWTKNSANRNAVAELRVGGSIIPDVPVDELMGLETRLKELRSLFQNMPTLDASQSWDSDNERGVGFYRTAATLRVKTDKKLVPITLAPATDKHPAQIEKTFVDTPTGTFSEIFLSGACSSAQKAELLTRIDGLIAEVRDARARANALDVNPVTYASVISDHLLGALK